MTLSTRPVRLSEESLPGSIWNNNGRWWWRVRLPGDAKRSAIPLKAPWAQKATVDRSVAVQIAWSIWKERLPADPAEELPAVFSVSELRRRWLASGVNADDELNTRPIMTLAGRPADSVRASEILELQERMITEGLGVRTINRRTRAMLRMFRWGVPRDLVTAEQWWGMSAISPIKASVCKRPPKEVQPADLGVVHQTLAACRPVLWRMVVLQLLTGMRSGELVRMRPCDIETAGDVWLYRVPQHKTRHRGHTRIVAIGPRAQEVLAPALVERPADAPVFAPDDAERERGVTRRADQARPLKASYTPHSYQQSIEYAIAKVNAPIVRENKERAKAGSDPLPLLSHWHAHQLRHAAGTIARDVAGPDGAQALLGHRHLRVTEVYAKLNAKRAGEVAMVIG